MMQISDAVWRTILNRLIADAPAESDPGILFEVKVLLFQNDVTPNRNTVLADLDVATFSGYATLTAQTFNPALTDDDGNTRVIGPVCQFTATAATITNTIYGYYVTDTAGTLLLGAERFDEPVEVTGAGDGVALVPTFGIGR